MNGHNIPELKIVVNSSLQKYIERLYHQMKFLIQTVTQIDERALIVQGTLNTAHLSFFVTDNRLNIIIFQLKLIEKMMKDLVAAFQSELDSCYISMPIISMIIFILAFHADIML
jgi:hypothetical protein